MTDMPDTTCLSMIRTQMPGAAGPGFRIEETFWGYRIVPRGIVPCRMVMLQLTALAGGAIFMAAAVSVVMANPADILFRLPILLGIGAIGAALLWCATRGALVQFEVDAMQSEVREVVRHRTGRATVLARYGIDCVGGVFIQRCGQTGASLKLRYRNTARTMTIAAGDEADLMRLRDRLGRDLIVGRSVP